MWKSILREQGYDPSIVRDAIEPLEVGEITRQDLNGSVVGSPCQCCGAKLIRRALGAELAWVGAKTAIVVYNKRRILRYFHNGGIPSQFDHGFFPLGAPLRLTTASPTQKLGVANELNRQKRPRKKPYANRFPSIVGQFRR